MKNLIRILLAFMVATLVFMGQFGLAFGQTGGDAAQSLTFDHNTTGYMLDTTHRLVQCESCHTSGVFRGTPRACATCHAGPGARAPGKASSHIPTTAACDVCHRAGATSWAEKPTGFTQGASGHPINPLIGVTATNCNTCHNGAFVGVNALTKPPMHIQTFEPCSTCHSTTSWLPATNPHAGGVNGRCSNCHNGVNAKGKTPRHIPTSASCDTCHNNFVAFTPSVMNHTGLNGQCSTCHSGAYESQNAQGKTATHVITTAQCDTCHNSTTTWATGVFDHAAASPAVAGRCSTCHNGTNALGKPNNHVPSAAQCDTCHTNQVAFKPAQMNHSGTVGQCATCHSNGTYAFANALNRSGLHIQSGSVACDSCHTLGFVSWTPAVMNHTGLNGKCSSCHSGGYLPQNAQTKPATHISTTAQCDTCHSSTTTWATGVFDHTTASPAVTGRCSTCHNGTNALGKSTTHIPDTRQCDTCHKTFAGFATAVMDHTGMAGKCSTCHNGGFTVANALGLPKAGHIPTTAQCDICHSNGFVIFPPEAMNHTGLAKTCDTCHGGAFTAVNAMAKPSTHISTTAQCDTCHVSTTTWTAYTYNHDASAFNNCSTCHGAGVALGMPANHIPTTAQCDSCHTNFASFKPAKMVHTTAMNGQCFSCHNGNFNGVNAQSKPATHIQTQQSCDICHGTSLWKPVVYVHPSNAAGTCSTCHNGVNALGKPTVGHIPTSSQCDTCHSYQQMSFKPATMNHTGLTGQCSTCHNGNYVAQNALGKMTGHIPVTAQCDTCHVNTSNFKLWSPVAMNHTGLTACASCHSGAYLTQNAQVKPATHIATTAECSTCHTGTTTWATGVFNHATASPAVTGRCSTCHNGTNGIGKPSTHIPTTAQCDTCHTNFTAFKPAQMNHAGMAGQCASCHNGSYVAMNAQTKPLTHVPTTSQCDTCHGSTTDWKLAVAYVHAPTVYANCTSAGCHNGVTAMGQGAGHIPTPGAQPCSNCHKNFVSFKPAQMAHIAVAGTCSNCHNATYAAKNALPMPPAHIQVSTQCDTCHINGYVTWSPAVMNHTGLTACSTCHGGAYLSQNAQMKPATHVSTTNQCSTCHLSTTSWSTAVNYVHPSTVVLGSGGCSTCHNSTTALGKSTNHIPTTGQCDTCHATFVAFAPAAMNHTGTTGQCSTCHSGAFTALNAQVKSATHIPTTQSCDTCHGTVAWKPTTYTHQGVVAGTCATCHNGTSALGKTVAHIPTTAACDTCHKNYTAFAPATMNHTGLAGQCATCHSGTYVSINAQKKTATHIATSAQCDTCHNSTTTWATGVFNHATASPAVTGRCSTCHNGINALGLPTTHIPTQAAECDTCHTNTTAFKPAKMNHIGTTAGKCSWCHSGNYLYANALAKPANHIPDSRQCDTCHKNGFVTWSPSTMDHTGLTQCTTCHNGTYLAQNAQSKPVTHQSTTAQCSSCHTSTTSWAIATQNHAVLSPPATGRCSTCHNGTTALGKSTNHIPTTGQCDTCHNTFVAFAPALMNHTGTTGQCASCHSGAYTALNAQIKPATHIQTTASCDTCHGTIAWKPATYAHTGVAAGTCASCHNGTNALGKNATHIPVTTSCDNCHKNYVAFFPAQMSHTGLNGQCSTCHSGAYVAVNAQKKSATHVSTVLQCDTCHTSTTTWANATFAHATPPGVCSTCHNGTTALGKPTTHIPTSATCDTCHKNQIAFNPAQMSHTGLTTCNTCHNGTYVSVNALAKPAAHIPVTSDCIVCHTQGFVTWSPSVMNHTGLTACSTCHSGAYLSQNAQTKPVTHQATTAQCSSCHSSTVSWAMHTQDHSVLVPAATGRCSTCHNSVIAIGKSTNHIPTTGQCDTCHNNYTLFAPAVMNHTGTAGVCATCHGGAYTTLNAQAKSATHMPTTQSCDYCHTTTLWRPTSFAHTAAQMGTNSCATCHNGTIASGKPALHIPTTAACSVCHRTGISWLPLILPYAHTGIAAGTCSTCHVSSYPSISYKPANHLPTTAACDVCHNKTAWTGPYTFNHVGVVAGTCDSCHATQYTGIVAKPTNHMPYGAANKCDACHTTSSFATLTKTGSTLHAMLTATPCYSCHDRSSTYLVGNAASFQISRSSHHSAGSKDCSTSGCHRPLGTIGSAYTKWN